MDEIAATAERLLGISPPPPAQPWSSDSCTDPPDYPRKPPSRVASGTHKVPSAPVLVVAAPEPTPIPPPLPTPPPEPPEPPEPKPRKKSKQKRRDSSEDSSDSDSNDSKRRRKDRKKRYSDDRDRPAPAPAPAPAPVVVLAPLTAAPQAPPAMPYPYPPPAPYAYPPPPPPAPPQQYGAPPPPVAPPPPPPMAPPPPGAPMTINVGQQGAGGETAPPANVQQPKPKKSDEPWCPHWVYCYFWFISFVVFAIGILSYALGATAFYNSEFLAESLMKESKGHLKGFNGLNLLEGMAINLMWSGMAITAMGFFGCCGLMCKNLWMLNIYGFLISVLVLIQVIFVIIFAVNKDLVLDSMRSKLKSSLSENYDGLFNTTNQVSGLFNVIMVLYQCCGITDPSDFRQTVWYKNRTDLNQTVPETCCALNNQDDFLRGVDPVLKSPECPNTNLTQANPLPPYLNRGCFSAFWNRILEMEHTIQMLVVVSLVFQSTAICSTFTVRRKITEEEELLKINKEAKAKQVESTGV